MLPENKGEQGVLHCVGGTRVFEVGVADGQRSGTEALVIYLQTRRSEQQGSRMGRVMAPTTQMTNDDTGALHLPLKLDGDH